MKTLKVVLEAQTQDLKQEYLTKTKEWATSQFQYLMKVSSWTEIAWCKYLRFREAEDKGLKCVLLYFGDFDPDGLRISDTMRKNLFDIRDVFWSDGKKGYDPSDLEIHRFGLNYDLIIENNYTWIDNLITGSGNELARVDEQGKIVAGLKVEGKNAGQKHQNFDMPYLQQYVQDYGVRKCESNALVTTPRIAEDVVRSEIEKWLGPDAKERFATKRFAIEVEYQELLDESRLREPLEEILGDEED